MREILFRGKRYDDKNLILSDSIMQTSYGCVNLWHEGKWIEVIPRTVGQYTGLKDKNGTKIFEGDIIKDKDNNVFIMEYGEFFADDVSNMFFDMFGHQGNFNLYGLYAVGINSKKENIMPAKHSCVIIGNIHDNPELLNAEDSL